MKIYGGAAPVPAALITTRNQRGKLCYSTGSWGLLLNGADV